MYKSLGWIAAGLLVMAEAALAFGPLTEPNEAAARDTFGACEEDLVCLDVRSDRDFAAGHMAGAVNIPYGVFRGPRDNPGRVPAAAELQTALRSAGLDADDAVLVVHEGRNTSDFGAAARVYWTLKTAGFTKLSILNGGYAGWVAAGGAIAKGKVEPTPSTIVVGYTDAWWMDHAGVKAVADGRSDAVLIDARPDAFFQGKTKHGAAQAPGTIVGAINFVNDVWFARGSPRIDPSDALISSIRSFAGEQGERTLVSFCNTGHWAATNWFVASEVAGIQNVKLYPESMVGWTNLGLGTVFGQ